MRGDKDKTTVPGGRHLSVGALWKEIHAQEGTLRSKLLLYFCCFVLVGSGILIVILLGMGILSESDRSLKQSLNVQLRNRERDMKERLDFVAGSGIDMAEHITALLEHEVLRYPYDIRELNNDKEQLENLQKQVYPLLEGALKFTRTSGVFVIFDATVNTEAPGAEHSRSGLYLRQANLSSGNALKRDLFLFRGNPEVAIQNQIQMHNRWNMEFDINQMDWYHSQMNGDAETLPYLWAERHQVTETWESAAFLSAPLYGSGGLNYGLCGFEISSLLYSLDDPAVESEYGDMVTVFMPIDGDCLLLSEGLIGGQGDIDLQGTGDLRYTVEKNFNRYRSDTGCYLGLHSLIPGVRDSRGRTWGVAVLISCAEYGEKAAGQRTKLLLAIGVFILIMMLSAAVLSARFVRPIVQRLEELKTDGLQKQYESSGISEIDALTEFLKLKEKEYRSGGSEKRSLPPNIEELFDRFVARTKTLTASEKNILDYYIRGHEIAEIPDLACISMNTVRKHNRNIYEKLGIHSRDELKLYLDLLERCGRIGELEKEGDTRIS